MDVAEDDMPRYAKARDKIPFVVATLDGRHLGELEEGKDRARLFERLRKSCC
jgi:predicted Ser/Thr protein kinase